MASSTKQDKGPYTKFRAALLCLLFLLFVPLAAQANDQSAGVTRGWSLLPASTDQNKTAAPVPGSPNYNVNPATLTALRTQTVGATTAPTSLRLQNNSQHPLFFELHNEQFNLASNLQSRGQLDLSSVLGWQPMEKLVVALGLQTSIFEQPENSTQFQTISNIQCESAAVEPGLYHASNCHFINGANALNQPINNFASLGTTWAPNKVASLQLEYFRQNTTSPLNNSSYNSALPGLLTSGHNPLTDNRALLPAAVLGGNSSLDGYGVNLALGFEHDQMGKLHLGLQLSQINHAQFSSTGSTYNQTAIPLTPISPFHTATVNIDWNRGAFSGGVSGFYRESLNSYNQLAADEFSGFDIYFSWHAPWNAELSIGTSTQIEPGANNKANDESSNDPFEMVYGRVPYVRYEQNL